MAPTKKVSTAASSDSKAAKKASPKTAKAKQVPHQKEAEPVVKKTGQRAASKNTVKEKKPTASTKTNKKTASTTAKNTAVKKTKKAKETFAPQTETLFQEPVTLFQETAEQKIVPSVDKKILELPSKNVPQYTPVVDQEINASKGTYANIVAHSSILEALQKSQFSTPNQILQTILPAALRGSDVLAYKPVDREGFLLGTITAASRLLNEHIPKGTPGNPSVLFISSQPDRLDHAFNETTNIFSQLDFSFDIVKDTFSQDERQCVLNKSIDVLFISPAALSSAQKNSDLKLKNVGLCFVHGIEHVSAEDQQHLNDILKALPLERVQKIFVSNANTGKVREMAFEHLEDPEFFSLLPCYVKERVPKQFGHALTVTQKFQVLLGHLKHHKPQCAVVYANTSTVAEWIAFKLHGNGVKVELLSSQLYANKRRNLIQSSHSKEVNVIVTTDHHGKNFGLDDLNCIYHFDIPDSFEKFIVRLNRIEGSRFPISVLFVCEDYGFNMDRIEKGLGFKIYMTEPDKNYFTLKDVSEYPLEPSGRVKKIGQQYDSVVKEPVETTAPTAAPMATPVAAETIAVPVTAPIQPAATSLPKLHPRSAANFRTNGQEKFGYRDFKARDVAQAAKQASQAAADKRKEVPATSSTNTSAVAPKQINLLAFAVTLAGDAVKAAVSAAKDSISRNMAENQPTFFGLFKKKEKK